MTIADLPSPSPSPVRLRVLHGLLDESLAFAPEFARGMSNHLPMALAALDGLGASEAQMRSFFAHYAKRLEAAPADVPPSVSAGADWRTLKGRAGPGFATLRPLFAADLARRGRDAVLRDALPALMDGAAGGAMHGPIRAAHAIESAHAGELAAALAYWAATWTPLPAPPASATGFASAADWLAGIRARLQATEPQWRSAAPLISDRMQEAARTRAYAELGASAFGGDAPPRERLADLARAAAAAYAGTGNFTVLHLATAARAAGVLSPWMPAGEGAWTPFLHAVAAATLAAVAVPHRRRIDGALVWADVRRQACASDDDHVIKLVHAMAVQHQARPDPAWLQAARVALAASQ